jgi:50S ribosomal subunit-associated GTPase HflX
VSALQPESLEALKAIVRTRIRQRLQTVRLRIPASEGETLAEIHRVCEVLETTQTGRR